MTQQNHYRFMCEGNLPMAVSAPTEGIARARLEASFSADEIVLTGINDRQEPYEFEPREWASGRTDTPYSGPHRKVSGVEPLLNPGVLRQRRVKDAPALTDVEQATASLLEAMRSRMGE